jgi:hypothetical protein
LNNITVNGAIAGDGTLNINEGVVLGNSTFSGTTNINAPFSFNLVRNPTIFGTSEVNLNNTMLTFAGTVSSWGGDNRPDRTFQNILNVNTGSNNVINIGDANAVANVFRFAFPNVILNANLLVVNRVGSVIDGVLDFCGIQLNGFTATAQNRTNNNRTHWIGIDGSCAETPVAPGTDPDEGDGDGYGGTDGGDSGGSWDGDDVPGVPNTAGSFGSPFAIIVGGTIVAFALFVLTKKGKFIKK